MGYLLGPKIGALYNQVDITHMFYMGSRWSTFRIFFFFFFFFFLPLSFSGEVLGVLSECLISLIQTFLGEHLSCQPHLFYKVGVTSCKIDGKLKVLS